VEPAENQIVQFPGCNPPGEWNNTAETREDARLLAVIVGGD